MKRKISTNIKYYIAVLLFLAALAITIIGAAANGEIIANNEIVTLGLKVFIVITSALLCITVIGFLGRKRSKKYLKSFFSALLKLM